MNDEREPRDEEGQLDHVTPRAAAATLLLIDRVIEEYELDEGRHVHPVDRRVICDVLRAVARRDRVRATE